MTDVDNSKDEVKEVNEDNNNDANNEANNDANDVDDDENKVNEEDNNVNTQQTQQQEQQQQEQQQQISPDDIKDNTNDEEKTYESKEDIEKLNKTAIPQNLEQKPLGKKNKIVIGSFDPSTFHYSFKNQRDPLQIGMFPTFGYLQIPHVGVYGDSYEPTQLRALMELSINDKLISNLPNTVSVAIQEIMSKISTKDTKIEDIFEGFVAIHYCPPYKQTQHFSMNANNLFNIMYHSWFYNTIDSLSNDQQIQDSLYCGLFEGCNVYEIRNDPNQVKEIVDRGVPFNRLEERSCFLHGFAFSPCNNDIARDEQAGYCSFYMIGYTKDYKRACLSYHVFANNSDNDEILKWSLKEVTNVKELLTVFASLQWGSVAKNLQILCQHY